ncbi:cytochrome P450 3A41-like isoform X3 [Dermacentor albipictus]|uniref:cytochrome P450 3A41-like isoform X3 n=1 Tax=Dermacentor albipictus TaxID=60249 RepID=UPI0038FCCF25
MFLGLCSLLVVLATTLFWWVRKTLSFWSDKDVVHHNAWQYLRFAFDIYSKPLNEVVARNYNHYGRVYGSYQGTVPTLVVGDTNILREVLVSKFKYFSDRTAGQRIGSDVWRKSILNLSGDEWKKARGIFTPALTATQLKTITVRITAIAERMTGRVAEAAARNKPVNFSELFDHTSLDTTAALNYSVDLDSDKDKDHPLMNCLEAIFGNMAGWKLLMLFLMPSIYKALQPDYPPKASTDVFKAFVAHMIEERKSRNKKEEDFLQLFMDADYDWDDANNGAVNEYEKKKMTLDEITAQGIVFFIAGVESVSMTTTFTAYFLALHSECQDKAISEIDKAVSEGGLTYDALQEMHYLEASIKEAMRLTSPDPLIMRLCTEETTVAGIRFTPGMNVDIPLAGMHLDPEYFPQPENFSPERFLAENKDSIRPFTYMPFGAGPRNCAGSRLALLQAKTYLACLLRRFRLEACSETMIPLKYKPRRLFPFPDGPVILRAVARCPSTDGATAAFLTPVQADKTRTISMASSKLTCE